MLISDMPIQNRRTVPKTFHENEIPILDFRVL
jgi:hypothetical protein